MELKRVKASRTKFLRLSETPRMNISITCSACYIELIHDGDNYSCDSCGHYWWDFGDYEKAEPIDFTEFDEADFEEEVTDIEEAYVRGDEVRDSFKFV